MPISKRHQVPIALLACALGVLALAIWFASEATTVVPGSNAVFERYITSFASLFFSGFCFGISVTIFTLRRQQKTKS